MCAVPIAFPPPGKRCRTSSSTCLARRAGWCSWLLSLSSAILDGMSAHDAPLLLIELGAAILGLAVLARLASRIGLSAIPLYLLAGLAFGKGGLAPLNLSQNFISIGAEI